MPFPSDRVAMGAAFVQPTDEVRMLSMLTDLARHAGQLTLTVLFMGILAAVLYGETNLGVLLGVVSNAPR
ncbi:MULTISPECIES: hypothetical protein [Cupriavidus]|uniref:Uncharacterized protein n=1 Tax=Cupriavidus cauae TaxID=2608999 RepID=A0A5M8A831_9BURK|nr:MULTISPECIES: hypothetical protein [Cupriavidus]KAA0181265.1 hypothetical protein FX016_11360 [Cupriavidus gilardii]KAA6118839.1 hypothetical protein F1599_19135 [Cupriavidus cauae]MCA7085268.1 hypothetical protein [Cupriavidus sp. DB3]